MKEEYIQKMRKHHIDKIDLFGKSTCDHLALAEAILILASYKNEDMPSHCEHDVMTISGVHPNEMEVHDAARLEELGWSYTENFEGWGEALWYSYRFGSA